MISTVITGASGLLGGYLMRADYFRKIAVGTSYSRRVAGLKEVDLTVEGDAHRFLSSYQPEHIVHAVALSDVDRCEENVAEAYQLTVRTTQHLVSWITTTSPRTKLTYISTDHVYDGAGPHSESSPRPSNVYSLTKLCAEALARQVDVHLVLRVNFFGCGHVRRETLSDWIIRSLRQGETIRLFRDVYFSPLHLEHLAEAIAECTGRGLSGTFNLGASGGGISKAGFAALLAEVFGLSLDRAEIVSVSNRRLKAYRPRDMRMSVDALESVLGHRLPSIREGIELLHESMEGKVG